jgi:hypothetical protein
LVGWSLNSGLCICKAGTLLLEPHLQLILLLCWRCGLVKYLPGLAWTSIFPFLASQTAGITGVSHWHLNTATSHR